MRVFLSTLSVCVSAVLLASLAHGQSNAPIASDAVASASHASPATLEVDEVSEGLSSEDWASIRAAYEAGRYAAFAVDGEHRARNPGQQWTTRFDGRGFTTAPDTGAWTWGLQLEAYGWGAAEHGVAPSAAVTADGQRVSYAWGSRLTEWYVNDRRGLEHGYTVHSRPEGATGALALELAIRGGLLPVVSEDGRDVHFVNQTGGAALTYAGLTVFDAEGQPLAAGWKVAGERLHLWIEDQAARYPLTIDPIAQQAYLKASNTGAFDGFGYPVAVSGDTVVVGAPSEDSAATGVDGDQSSNAAPDSGAAYVFVRSGTTWTQQAYLKASNTGAGDFFGISAAVSGDTVVVGAPNEASAATGVDGDQSSNAVNNSGAAYVFDLDLLPDPWTDVGSGLAGVSGVPVLAGTGTLIGGDPVSLALSNANPNSTVGFILGFSFLGAPFKGGTLVPAPDLLVTGLPTDGSGTLVINSTWPTGIPSGSQFWMQEWIADPAGPEGFSASNGLLATTP